MEDSYLEKQRDKRISIAIMATFIVLTFQYFILVTFNLLGTSTQSTIEFVSKLIVGLLCIYAIPDVIKRSKIKLIVFTIIAIIIFLINFLLFPENYLYVQQLIIPFFLICLPMLVYSNSIRDLQIFRQIMKYASFIVLILGVIITIVILSGRATIGSYSMTLSYYMLLPAIIYLDELFERLSFKAWTFSVTSIIIILSLGSRGALLCLGIFVLLKIIRINIKSNLIVSLFSIITGVTFILLINLTRIMEFLFEYLLQFGIRSRSISLFLNDDLSLTGRDYIYINTLDQIANNPITGIGIGGDRRILGVYPHNIILELLTSFGLLFGGILIILLAILVFRLLITKNKDKYSMFIIWLSLGFIPLLMSHSFITEFKFWIFLGFALQMAKINNTTHLNEKHQII